MVNPYVFYEAAGVPYSYGGGSLAGAPATWPKGGIGKYGGRGYDCSGYFQGALWRAGLLRQDAWDDAGAAMIYYRYCYPIQRHELLPGDGVFYVWKGRIVHVMVAIDSQRCIGATGGGSRTNANDPDAMVKEQPIDYWASPNVRILFGRLRPEYRAEGARLPPMPTMGTMATIGGFGIALVGLLVAIFPHDGEKR